MFKCGANNSPKKSHVQRSYFVFPVIIKISSICMSFWYELSRAMAHVDKQTITSHKMTYYLNHSATTSNCDFIERRFSVNVCLFALELMTVFRSYVQTQMYSFSLIFTRLTSSLLCTHFCFDWAVAGTTFSLFVLWQLHGYNYTSDRYTKRKQLYSEFNLWLLKSKWAYRTHI